VFFGVQLGRNVLAIYATESGLNPVMRINAKHFSELLKFHWPKHPVKYCSMYRGISRAAKLTESLHVPIFVTTSMKQSPCREQTAS
jgi:hypothetical protein